jgi:hypothetical protein
MGVERLERERAEPFHDAGAKEMRAAEHRVDRLA